MSVLRMADLELNGKRVLIREDLNVPVKDGKITSDARLQAALPSIRLALDKGAKLMVMSHLGRPTEGELTAADSLKIIADYLRDALQVPVHLVADYLNGVEAKSGEVVLFENVRCNPGEKKNSDELAKKYAALCDVFVMDAFGTAHRAEASTHGVAKFAEVACAGPLLAAELDALTKALDNPARPLVAIVGGSKVSTKLTLLDSLLQKVDQLIVGGGIANTFIASEGHGVGLSLVEMDMLDQAKNLTAAALARGSEIPKTTDVVVGELQAGQGFADLANAPVVLKPVNSIDENDMVADIGPQTADRLCAILKNAGTIVWNGPVGVFELDAYAQGSRKIAEAIAESPAFSIAGGGDTLAAVEKFGVSDKISYISTGGGAFLEFLEGKTLPAVEILQQRAQQRQAQ